MQAYYNEIDPFAAQWLRNLISSGHIPGGTVDERSIAEVQPSDLDGFKQCHFFAGIGVWAYALKQAGWADDQQVWTGSCPCQPFSCAGKGEGINDERHLWPEFFRLIKECKPATVFGEQVASKDGLTWLDIVSTDLESSDYAFASADMCAAGVGAPHIRQRLYWLADSIDSGRHNRRRKSCPSDASISRRTSSIGRDNGQCLETYRNALRLADAERNDIGRETSPANHFGTQINGPADRAGVHCGASHAPGPSNPTNGFWRDVDWLGCRDGKFRPVEPGTFPLANGASSRVGRLRAYGNAIVAPQAVEFVIAAMECLEEVSGN